MARSTPTEADTSAAPLPELPEDVVFEILARLPVRSVLRCRSVCKAWLAMLADPSFVRRHADCSKENPSAVIGSTLGMEQCQPRRRVRFDRYRQGDEGAELLLEHALPDAGGPIYCPAHCDGLLALYDQTATGGTTYVCNPATRELVALPPCLPFDYGTEYSPDPFVGLCRDYRSGAYKVFHAFYYRSDSSVGAWNVRVEVLMLEAENPQWRVLPSCVHCLDVLAPRCIASVDGAVYLLLVASPDPILTAPVDRAIQLLLAGDAASPFSILSLDASTEEFMPVPAPPSDWLVCRDTRILSLREIHGKLCFCCGGTDRLVMTTEIWFMSGTPASPAWTRYGSFRSNLFLWHHFPVLELKGREILFSVGKCFYSYNPRSHKFKVTDVLTGVLNLETCSALHTYAESLVPIIPTRPSRQLQPTATCD